MAAVWTLAGKHRGLWRVAGFSEPVHGYLKVGSRGKSRLELLLTDEQRLMSMGRMLERTDAYQAIVGMIVNDQRLNPVTLLRAWHTAIEHLLVTMVVFGSDLSEDTGHRFSQISLYPSGLAGWPFVADGQPISVPWDTIRNAGENAIALSLPPDVPGSDLVPSIGLAPEVSLRDFSDLDYRLCAKLAWNLDAPRDLDGCISLVHAAHTLLILLVDSTVQMDKLVLRDDQGMRVDVVYEPNPSGKAHKRSSPILGLRAIVDRYQDVWTKWTGLCNDVPAVVGAATHFHYATSFGEEQLFVLTTAMEALSARSRRCQGPVPSDLFNEAKRALLGAATNLEVKKLVQDRVQNEWSLRQKLKDLTAPLEAVGLFTRAQRLGMVDDFVKARNGFGHTLTTALVGRGYLRRVYQAHITLKALLLDELGILDVAADYVREQWQSWESQ